MTAFIVTSIATMLLMLLAQFVLNWKLDDAHDRLDRQMNYITSLESELLELQHKVYRLEKKGGAE